MITKRGLGPFSGGQLTLIVVTFAILLLLPVGAWALSSTNVSIIDRGGVNKAVVNTAGRVAVQTGLPGTPWVGVVSFGSVTVPANKTLSVEMLSISTDVTTGHDMIVTVHFTTGGKGADLYIAPTKVFTASGYDAYQETVPVSFYADGGTNITIAGSSVTGSAGSSFMTVTGHLNT